MYPAEPVLLFPYPVHRSDLVAVNQKYLGIITRHTTTCGQKKVSQLHICCE